MLTALLVDIDAAYVVANKIRRHEERPDTTALSGLADTYQYDQVDHAQRLKTELHRPTQPGNTMRGYIADLTRIKVELHDMGQPLSDKELISCMVNGIRVPEYMAERNFLVHNPQTDFEVACALCRKTAIQDTIVAGVAGALPPVAFYSGPLVPPPSLGRRNLGAPELPSPTGASLALARLTEALNKLTESISMI